jgi:hypothetical protein
LWQAANPQLKFLIGLATLKYTEDKQVSVFSTANR